jgi:hypothetical protein
MLGWFLYAVASAIAALVIAVGLFLFPWWSERCPNGGPSSQFTSRWRRFAGAWPFYIVIFGTVLSLGWAAMLVWVVLDLVGLT